MRPGPRSVRLLPAVFACALGCTQVGSDTERVSRVAPLVFESLTEDAESIVHERAVDAMAFCHEALGLGLYRDEMQQPLFNSGDALLDAAAVRYGYLPNPGSPVVPIAGLSDEERDRAARLRNSGSWLVTGDCAWEEEPELPAATSSLCRGFLNYCVGREMATAALSGEADSPLDESHFWRVSRERLASAAYDFIGAMEYMRPAEGQSDVCTFWSSGTPRPDSWRHEERVSQAFLEAVRGIATAANREVSTINATIESMHLRGDDLDAARAYIVGALYGHSPLQVGGDPFSGLQSAVAPLDDTARRALLLAHAYNVPVGVEQREDSWSGATHWGFVGDTESSESAREARLAQVADLTYRLLDHRVHEARFGSSALNFGQLSEGAVNSLPDPPGNPTATLYGVGKEAIARAVTWVADLRTTPLVFLEPTGSVLSDGSTAMLGSALIEGVARRPAVYALASASPPSAYVDRAELFLEPPPVVSDTSSSPQDNWYTLDLRRIDTTRASTSSMLPELGFGATNALASIRVHALRVRSGNPLDDGPMGSALTNAVSIVNAAIGTVWTETTPSGSCAASGAELYRTCESTGGQDCDHDPNKIEWSLLFDPSIQPELRDASFFVVGPTSLGCMLGGVSVDCGDPVELVEATPTSLDFGSQLIVPDAQGSLPAFPIGAHRVRRFEVPLGAFQSGVYVVAVDANAPTRPYIVDVIAKARTGVHAFGGDLGAAVARYASTPRDLEPVVASDRGTPSNLVPPLEGELIADQDEYEDSWDYYLTTAERAAAVAQEQLDEARAEVLALRLDEALDELSLQEATTVQNAQLAGLCGENGSCEVPRVRDVDATPGLTFESIGWITPFPAPAVDCEGAVEDFLSRTEFDGIGPSDLLQLLECQRYLTLDALAGLPAIDLPSELVPLAFSDEVPRFENYGGALRSTMIDGGSQIVRLRRIVRDIASSYGRARAAALIANNSWDDIEANEKTCTVSQWGSLISGVSNSVAGLAQFGSQARQTSANLHSKDYLALGETDLGRVKRRGTRVTSTSGYLSAIGQTANGTGTAIGVGSSLAQNHCGDSADAERTSIMQRLGDALFEFAQYQAEAADVAASLVALDGVLDDYVAQASFLQASRDGTARLLEANALADLPEWRALSTFRYRRGSESADRAIVALEVARRAIEFRLGVRLDEMREPEALVAAPASWAADLAQVPHLSAQSAGESEEHEIDRRGEALVDYATNLRRFVQGYPFGRRFQAAEEYELLRLSELYPSSPIWTELLYVCKAESLEGFPLYNVGTDLEPGDIPCADAGGVDYASISFSIAGDRGVFQGAERPRRATFNRRHGSVAVNLVGGSVLDCNTAATPSDCWADGNLPYELRHRGSVSFENYEGAIVDYDMEPGVLTGRAVAAGRSLSRPLSSTDRGFTAAYAAAELRGRPYGGSYEIRIPGRPEVDWTEITDIEFVMSNRVWVRQE